MTRRKRFTLNQYATRWEAYDGKCWRCGLPLDKHKRGVWHWGHIVALGCGGDDVLSNVAAECRSCNETDNREHTTPLASKIKRIRNRFIGLKKPPSQLAKAWAWKKRILAERKDGERE